MWAEPDSMKAMLDQNTDHPLSGEAVTLYMTVVCCVARARGVNRLGPITHCCDFACFALPHGGCLCGELLTRLSRRTSLRKAFMRED